MSSEMPWMKWYTESLDDPKFGRLTDQQKWRFVEACTIAAECDKSGAIIGGDKALTLEDIAWRIRSTVEHIRPDYEMLISLGMILVENGVYTIKNFEKRQGRPWHEKREMWAKNKREQRSESDQDTSSESPRGQKEDTSETPRPRGEERRLEEIREEERRGTTPPASNPSLFTSTDKGALVFKMLKAEYRSTTDHFETNAQREAYLDAFECLDGELEAVVKKGLAKGIRTKGDMLVWLQGCVKASAKKEKTSKRDKPGKTYR
jgi:hypothetical protein